MKKSLRTMKTIVIMLLCLSMIFCNIAFASEAPDEKGIDTAYEFPITPASESWNKLTTINDKIAACQIPNDILLNLTTSALIETVSNYPLAVNLYAYDTLKQGYDKVKEQFNGLAELERRFINAPAETEKALESFIESSKRTASSEDFRVYYMARIIQGVKATTTHGE